MLLRGSRHINLRVDNCDLHVPSVAFKRKCRRWRLVKNPFPATLHPGSCLCLAIGSKATEECPRCRDLVIESDDPIMPVKTLNVMAYTIWDYSYYMEHCDDRRKGRSEKRHTE